MLNIIYYIIINECNVITPPLPRTIIIIITIIAVVGDAAGSSRQRRVQTHCPPSTVANESRGPTRSHDKRYDVLFRGRVGRVFFSSKTTRAESFEKQIKKFRRRQRSTDRPSTRVFRPPSRTRARLFFYENSDAH